MEMRKTTSIIDEIRRPHTRKDRAADHVARSVGSWTFIGIQSALVLLWVTFNSVLEHPWDPYPFVLMNVLLSLQAAYTAPIIMMSQNRQGAIDRTEAQLDYEVNRHTRYGVEQLQEALAQNAQQLAELRTMVEAIAGCPGCSDRLRLNAAGRELRPTIRPGPQLADTVPPARPDSDFAEVPATDGQSIFDRERTF